MPDLIGRRLGFDISSCIAANTLYRFAWKLAKNPAIFCYNFGLMRVVGCMCAEENIPSLRLVLKFIDISDPRFLIEDSNRDIKTPDQINVEQTIPVRLRVYL